jgi:hypothetical protein
MQNLNIYCLSTYSDHFNLFKKLGYIPVGLGKTQFNNNWLRDHTGDNISFKNPYYSEFTFHYWFWKNLINKIPNETWIGFCAYRRFWANNNNLNSYEIDNVINIYNFEQHALKEINIEWGTYESILGEEIILNNMKLLKIIKNGGISSIIQNYRSFASSKMNIKFHFDIFHGVGNIEKAISLLEKNEQNDFYKFVTSRNSFNRGNMFICKSKNIINEFYSSLFKWLFDCEKIFGFDKNEYGKIRIYAFLGERYMSYWFRKYTKFKEWPIFFLDTQKNVKHR